MKNIKYWLLVSLVLLSGQVSSNTQNDVRYFAKIVGIISPFLDYQLVGEMSKTEALNTYHYRVEYDAENRVRKIAYFLRERPTSDAYFYAHQVVYDYVDAAKTSVLHTNRKVTRAYYDESGKPASMWRHYYMGGEIHKEVFTTTNRETTLTLHNIVGEQVVSDLGIYTFVKQELDAHRFVQRQYDKEGKATILTRYFPTETNIITIDAQGYLKRIINVDDSSLEMQNHKSSNYAEVVFHFDLFGNEMGWWFNDVDGNLVTRAEHLEDPGYAKWLYDFEWTDKRLSRFKHFTMKYYDENNKPVNNAQGFGMNRIHYKDNLPVGVEYFDLSKQLVEGPDGYAKVVIDRDNQGKRTEARFYNANNRPVTKGVAKRIYHYDQEGKQTGTDELDYQGNPITE